jgi:hypothetical protein
VRSNITKRSYQPQSGSYQSLWQFVAGTQTLLHDDTCSSRRWPFGHWLRKMDLERADSEVDDVVRALSGSPDFKRHKSKGAGEPDNAMKDSEPTPSPLVPRKPIPEAQRLTQPQREPADPDVPQSTPSNLPEEITTPETADTYDSSTLSRAELSRGILEYLQESMIEEVYGDTLSGHRSRIYVPTWPADATDNPGPLLHRTMSRKEANQKFHELFDPVRQWHKLRQNDATSKETKAKETQIVGVLNKNRRDRAAKAPCERLPGKVLLYQNLPDAALELQVWTFVNASHMAIRRKDLNQAERHINAALQLAAKLQYEPIVAKCWYWRGVVAEEFGDRQTAADSFLEAFPCVGIYLEGDLLREKVTLYKEDMLEMLYNDAEFAQSAERSEKTQKQIRIILGKDALFSKLKRVNLISESEWGGKNPTEGASRPGPVSPMESSRSIEESLAAPTPQIDDMLDDLRGHDQRNGSIQRLLCLEMEEEANHNSGRVSTDKIFEAYDQLWSAFQSIVGIEEFNEGFDNLIDVEHTVAWKVFKYTKIMAAATSMSEGSDNANSEDSHSGTFVNPLAVRNPDNQPIVTKNLLDNSDSLPNTLKKRPDLTINTTQGKDLAPPVQTPIDVIKQIRRKDITAEEKIAAFEQAMYDEWQIKLNKKKTKARLDLESNPQWREDIKEQQAEFDKLVQEEVENAEGSEDMAKLKVTQNQREYLEMIWGPDGVRPPTPSPTREARELEWKERADLRMTRFWANMTVMEYYRKIRAYDQLPKEKMDQTNEPKRPSSAFQWVAKDKGERGRRKGTRPPALALDSDKKEAAIPIPKSPSDSENVRTSLEAQSCLPIPVNTTHAPPLQRSRSNSSKTSSSSPSLSPSSLDSISRIPSNASSGTYEDINQSLARDITGQVEAEVAIDAMSDAMEKANESNEDLGLEEMVRIAEEAVSRTVSEAGSTSGGFSAELEPVVEEPPDMITFDESEEESKVASAEEPPISARKRLTIDGDNEEEVTQEVSPEEPPTSAQKRFMIDGDDSEDGQDEIVVAPLRLSRKSPSENVGNSVKQGMEKILAPPPLKFIPKPLPLKINVQPRHQTRGIPPPPKRIDKATTQDGDEDDQWEGGDSGEWEDDEDSTF